MALRFRKNALNRLASSEQLDSPVTRMPGYFGIAAAGGLIAAGAFLLWLFFAQIPVVSHGNGIYLKEQGQMLCFISIDEAGGIEKGMEIRASQKDGGILYGHVEKTESVRQPEDAYAALLGGNGRLLDYLTEGKPFAACILELEGADDKGLEDGAILAVQIHKGSMHPAALWLPPASGVQGG